MSRAGAKARGRGTVHDASATDMANRFQRYAPETERTIRKVEVIEGEMLKRLKGVWEATEVMEEPTEAGGYRRTDLPGYYEKVGRAIKQLECSSKDVELFSLTMQEFRNEENFDIKSGMFLSALINKGKDEEYIVHTGDIPICYLGYRNTKRMIVDGDVGDCLGNRMRSGSITVDGDVGLNPNGTGGMVGASMGGGSITMNGDARAQVGYEMKGGEIHLNGDFEGIGNMIFHGKIYHKGVLIVDK
jgi:hypothetical protein